LSINGNVEDVEDDVDLDDDDVVRSIRVLVFDTEDDVIEYIKIPTKLVPVRRDTSGGDRRMDDNIIIIIIQFLVYSEDPLCINPSLRYFFLFPPPLPLHTLQQQ
jgi:hypothetical protein